MNRMALLILPACAGLAAAQPCQLDWRMLQSPEPGIVAPVHCLASIDHGSGPVLYAGGSFMMAGGIPASRLVGWNGQAWSALGDGANNLVAAMSVFDGGGGPDLYVAGSFTSIGGQTVRRVARWDGAAWSVLGSATTGPNVGTVRALAVFNDGTGNALYAAGEFSTTGVAGTARIAKWNGASWSPLGTGLGGRANALAVFDDGSGPALYAGGVFTTAGGAPANRIAKWNGSAWSALGDGITDGEVLALASFNDGQGPALYAAGAFVTMPSLHVARWNGSAWSAVGNGFNSDVRALAVVDDGGGNALYAGGFFDNGASRIAEWDGTSWLPLEAGIDWDLTQPQNGSAVLALASFNDGSGPALFAAGEFHLAGNQAVQNIAIWGCPPPAPCYPNCDGSTGTPMLTGNDFSCFLNRFAAGDSYANCDASTGTPSLTANDFQCYLNSYVAGCS